MAFAKSTSAIMVFSLLLVIAIMAQSCKVRAPPRAFDDFAPGVPEAPDQPFTYTVTGQAAPMAFNSPSLQLLLPFSIFFLILFFAN
ncbi:hypothetical protein PIB30_009446 [Stylosanthes scabra]|uniref:Transmembrane protein n=1 Tax=Stylosanthes scabra TaxID=79078 RepID=A0ABU6X3E4_9FABA|nr:hypothetical protein [Stylosanthes scabra]